MAIARYLHLFPNFWYIVYNFRMWVEKSNASMDSNIWEPVLNNLKLLPVFVWKLGDLGNEDPVFGIYLTTLGIAITKKYNIISSNWKSSSKNWKVLIGISEEDISEEDILRRTFLRRTVLRRTFLRRMFLRTFLNRIHGYFSWISWNLVPEYDLVVA